MNITIEYRNPTPSHCDVALFINGALAGVLTLRQGELLDFQHFFFAGAMRRDMVVARGNPGEYERDEQ